MPIMHILWRRTNKGGEILLHIIKTRQASNRSQKGGSMDETKNFTITFRDSEGRIIAIKDIKEVEIKEWRAPDIDGCYDTNKEDV